MYKSLLPLLLALAVVTETSAQTTPASSNKTTAPSNAARRPVKKAANSTQKSTAEPPATPSPDLRTGVEARDEVGAGGNGAVGSKEGVNSKGLNVYAAPGMPVHVKGPGKVGGYDGPASSTPAGTKRSTTLTPK